MQRLENIWKDDSILLHSYYAREIDVLSITVKSATTGKKTIYNLDNPMVPIYIIKKNVQIEDYLDEIKEEDVDIYWVPEKNRVYAIADILGIPNYYERVKEGSISKSYVFLHKRLFNADKPISDLVMTSYVKKFTKISDNGLPVIDVPTIEKYHIGALDIETDIRVCPGEGDEIRSQQPINVITYIDNQSWTIKTIAVRNAAYKGQAAIERDIKKFERDLMDLIRHNIENLDIDEHNPDKKIAAEKVVKDKLMSILPKLKLDLTFTNSEAKMMREINKYVFNEDNPDYLYIYNASYDIHQQYLRSKTLHVNFDNLFKYKELKPITDFRYLEYGKPVYDLKKKSHSYSLNNPTKILDQMLLYYQNRIEMFAKHSLDATAKRELGTAKLDYSKICNWIGDFPYEDYKSFLMYNIIDVLIMLFLDEVTDDTQTLVNKRFNTVTEWERLFKPAKRTTNTFDYYSLTQGYIPSNERNAAFLDLNEDSLATLKEKNPKLHNVVAELKKIKLISENKKKKKNDKIDIEDEDAYTITGGCVTKPTLISHKIKEYDIFGNLNVKTYNRLLQCADLDAESLYPNTIISGNHSRGTLYGVIKGVSGYNSNDIGVLAAVNLINKNLATTGKMFFNLPSAAELLEKEYSIKPEKKYKYTNDASMSIHQLDGGKDLDRYISWWRKCYSTAYNVSDVNSGSPHNSLFIFSKDNNFEFSYMGTKVLVETSQSTANLAGLQGHNIYCGTVSKGVLDCTHGDWQEYLDIKTDDPDMGEILEEGTITIDIINKIKNAKYLTYRLQLGEYFIDILNRMIFTDFTKEIKYYVQKIYNNDLCYVIRLFSNYNLSNNLNINIEQRIVFYKL